ncbi:MAG: hypothetical protein HYU66_01585 [Armatimonadetes bacterium]|nr:hypothetical protein [Armatimonadota bacterium]
MPAQAATAPTRSYGDGDLADAGAAEESRPGDPDNAPAPAAPSGAAPARQAADAGESHWRQRADRLRRNVAAAERRVATLEEQLRQAGGFVPGPLPAACAEGHVVWRGEVSREITRVCDPDVLRAQSSQRLHASLERARQDLENARAVLDALPEEARRAGALPGWVR